MEEEAWPDPRPLPLVSKQRKPWPLQRSIPNWFAPWGHPNFQWVQWVSWSTRITWWSLHWWLQNERESGHQPPFPEWWDNLPPTVQKTTRQQHYLCSWGYSHQSCTELLPTHGPSPSWCSSLLWLNVLFQAIEGEDTENPFICHIMNLLWSLSNKGTHVRFCWVPSHCGIDGNERVDQLAKETLDQDICPLASVHYTDMKPLVNSYIQKLVQTKWDVAVHGRDLYLVKPTLGPPKKFQHLTKAEEVVITQLRIGHTKATKSHILSRGPPTGCHNCGQTLTIDHMLLECALLQECRDEYYTVDSLNVLFETTPETCIVEFLREAGFFYMIWCNSLPSTSPQMWAIWSDLSNCLENESNSETHLLV